MSEALTIPGVDAGVWQVRNRFDQAAAALADRHYCRRHPSNQVGGVGRVLVLTTPCERALWVTKWPLAGQPWDGLDAYRCSYFRNEGAGLSSDLIRAAMALTVERWGEPPADGWVTWCDRSKIASANPGYCFKQAGWTLDRDYTHPRLVRLRAAASSCEAVSPTSGASHSVRHRNHGGADARRLRHPLIDRRLRVDTSAPPAPPDPFAAPLPGHRPVLPPAPEAGANSDR